MLIWSDFSRLQATLDLQDLRKDARTVAPESRIGSKDEFFAVAGDVVIGER